MPVVGFFTDHSTPVQGAANGVGNLNAILLQTGTTADRPATVYLGMAYWNTTTNALQRNLDTFPGGVYDTLISTDDVVGTGSLRTLGTGARQAAAGNHSHS